MKRQDERLDVGIGDLVEQSNRNAWRHGNYSVQESAAVADQISFKPA
jgi:hypothetical protein